MEARCYADAFGRTIGNVKTKRSEIVPWFQSTFARSAREIQSGSIIGTSVDEHVKIHACRQSAKQVFRCGQPDGTLSGTRVESRVKFLASVHPGSLPQQTDTGKTQTNFRKGSRLISLAENSNHRHCTDFGQFNLIF